MVDSRAALRLLMRLMMMMNGVGVGWIVEMVLPPLIDWSLLIGGEFLMLLRRCDLLLHDTC